MTDRLGSTAETIAAISWAARERGTTYGKLAMTLTHGATMEIVAAYRRHLDEQRQDVHAEGKERRKRRGTSGLIQQLEDAGSW